MFSHSDPIRSTAQHRFLPIVLAHLEQTHTTSGGYSQVEHQWQWGRWRPERLTCSLLLPSFEDTAASRNSAAWSEPEVDFVSIHLHPSILHLPRKQVWTGGGPSLNFNTVQASPTSLASKCELGVVFLTLSTCLSLFHLPHIQTRARGELFWCFSTCATSLASKRDLEVLFSSSFDVPAPSSTSLVFEHKLEVVLFNVSTPLLLPPPNANRRWIFRQFQRCCYHFHLLRVQTQVRGGFFWCVGATDATTTTTTLVLTLSNILPAASRMTGWCETYTPPYSNVFPNIINTLKTRKKFWKALKCFEALWEDIK